MPSLLSSPEESEGFAERVTALPAVIRSAIRSPLLTPGRKKAQLRTRGPDLVDTAPFRFGIDNADDYHHGLSSRLGRPMRRIKEERKEQCVASCIDMRPSLSFGATRIKRHFALEVATAIELAAVRTGDRAILIDLCGPSASASTRSMNTPRAVIAKAIELYENSHIQPDDSDFALALRDAFSLLPSRSNIFIISDFMFPPENASDTRKRLALQSAYCRVREEIDALCARHEVALVAVHDERDFSIPHAHFQLCGGASRGSFASVCGGSAKSEWALQALWDERVEWLEELEKTVGANYCVLQTETEFAYVSELISFLAIRERR